MSAAPAALKQVTARLVQIIAVGSVVTAVGLWLAPERGWSNLLLVAVYITGLGIAGLLFVAIHYISGATWGIVLRRVPEAMWAALPLGLILMLGVISGLPHLYEWADQEHVAHDTILLAKQVWLNPTGYTLRTLIYFAIWMIPGWFILRNSALQDSSGDFRYTRRNVKLSTIWIVAGILPLVLASIDWLMSLEPHWYSTIYGFYTFSGFFISGLSFIIIVVIIFRRLGIAEPWITNSHLHELGRFLFSFVTFWVYIWFSQHMLIWYANIPEETAYYLKRHFGDFGALSVINVCLNWLVPFLILLPRWTKRSEWTMLFAASCVLIGHWLDLYLMIFPARVGALPAIGLLEAGAALMGLGAIGVAVFGLMGRRSLVPVGDPYLQDSLNLTVE